jgi:ectoine hydroxylase-related dioxygenase (phytanoyl-CoA dioxygenase family)
MIASMVTTVRPRRDNDWVPIAMGALKSEGCCVVENVLGPALIEAIRPAMYRCRERITAELGTERLDRAGELGVLRLMLKFEPVFFRLLELPEVLAIVDAAVAPTAILHLQNGFILPSHPPGEVPSVFQNRYHRDFPRFLNGYVASINVLFAIDRFTRDNGATFVVPGSHQRAAPPDEATIAASAIPVECASGSMVVFDSTLWHAAGANSSGRDRLAINHQFTRSWIKQQIDYVRAIGEVEVLRQPPRIQQLLGYWTRMVTSLDEYYRPEAERLYRGGQG